MDEEPTKSRLLEKIKANPTVPVGLLGFAGVVGYSLYNFKNKKQSTSLYLIHTRVIAQGTVVACLTLGVVYALINKHWTRLFPEKKN